MRKVLDERGVEPLAMKIFAGIVLLVLGIGIGFMVITWARGGVTQQLSFDVTVSPSSATVIRPSTDNSSTTAQVSVQPILGGYSQMVTLSFESPPTGVYITFDGSPTDNGTPPFSSTMTIQVDSSVALGTTTINIRGTGADGTVKTAAFVLTISAA